MSPELVVLGNLLVDDVVLPDGRTRMAQPGGAVLHVALGAALWGVPTGLVTWRGSDYPAEVLEALAARGVDLGATHPLGRAGARAWLLYEDGRRRIVHRLGGPSHAEVSPSILEVPLAWRNARAVHVAPMPLEVQRKLVLGPEALGAEWISLDPCVLWTEASEPELAEVAAAVDALFLSEDEVELTAREDPEPALRRLASGRLRFVVFKRGERGGLLYDARGDRFVPWAPRAAAVVDPTGAGDAFAAGFLAGWLRTGALGPALDRGVVSASFALEGWGAEASLRATPAEAEARRREWFGDGASRAQGPPATDR